MAERSRNMEDAHIQQESGLYQQGQFPSVVTTDDLVLEMGKMVVDKLNKEKLLLSLLAKTKAMKGDIVHAQAQAAQEHKHAEVLRLSNVAYEESNRKLGDELASVRQKLASLTTTLSNERQAHESEKRTILAEQAALRSENETLRAERQSQPVKTTSRKVKRG